MSKKILIFMPFLIILLFSLKDILILTSTLWPHLYPVVNTSPLTFEEIYCYLPFLSHFSLTNLSNFTFFPTITIIVNGIIFKWICFSNIDIYLFLGHFLFLLLSFWLIVLIYKRYISMSWALLFAFWGIAFYKNFSSIGYVFHVICNPGDIIKAANLTPLEITRTPFPSFSFFVFILCFYLATLKYKMSLKQYIALTTLWSLNIYVYLHNFVAGIMFWFCYIIFTHYIHKSFNIKLLSRTLIINIFVMVVVISPVIIKLFFSTVIDKEIIQNLGLIYRNSGVIFNQWGIFLSYVLPLILTIIVIRCYCLDYYELFYKFTPIFIMIGVEIIMLNLHTILGSFLQPHLFSIRIGNFFSRYLYFIPVIYFFSASLKQLFHNKTENTVAKGIHAFFENYIIRYRVVISTLGIMGISFLIISSTLKYYNNHEKHVAPRMSVVCERAKELIASGECGTLVSEDIPVNLLLSVLSKNTLLLVNLFNNYILSEEILDRLVLFAHIYGWDEKQFLNFMMPHETYKLFYTDSNFVVSDDSLKNGFGYWLTWHRRKMEANESELYRQKLLDKYRNVGIKDALLKYEVKIIQSSGEINPVLPVKLLKTGKDTKLYVVDIIKGQR